MYNLSTALAVCQSLGLPLHPNKCVGPATSLSVLGIERDSLHQVARLPEEKLLALKQLIHTWLQCTWCKKRELESLIGHLHHAAKVVWPGGPFFGVLSICCAAFVIGITPSASIVSFVKICCGGSTFFPLGMASRSGCTSLSAVADIEVTSDAAGSLGFGAYSQGQWFYDP